MSQQGAPSTSTNGMAIASFVTALVGLSLLGVIFGHVAQSQIKRTNESGNGFAIAGLVLGYLGCIGWLWFWLIFGALVSFISSGGWV